MMLFKIGGALCLSLALAQGWLLALYSTPAGAPLRHWLPGQPSLLRSHIDYLMMALFLLVFAALGATPPLWLAALAVAGAVANPILFFLTALRPEWQQHRPKAYDVAATLSFIATTIGFGGTVWSLAF